jgi:uncharacterized protein YciI
MNASLQLFAVIRVRGSAWQADRPMQKQSAWPEHAAFMNGLAVGRFIVLGGPLGDGRRVLHIVEADSETTVRQRLSQDPWEMMSILRTESIETWTVLLDRNRGDEPRAV